MKSYTLLFSLLLSIFILFPSDTFACACCAERGFYSIQTVKPDDYYLDILQKIQFAENTELYLGAGDFGSVRGLETLINANSEFGLETFSLTDAFNAKTWRLNFKSKNGKTGTLVLPMPAQMLQFKADIHDNSDKGLGPVLYKEMRFKGNVQTGGGFFQSGIVKPTTYFLVFQGRGNACDNPEDYTNWRLEINGKKADYAFIGKLNSGNSEVPKDENGQQ